MSLRKWFHGPLLKVYLSQTLSTWGDRMWWFAGGIFLKDLGGSQYDSLMLIGVYTFVLSASVVSFGSLVGKWVDRTPRLQAAQKALLAQNLLLVMCAITICMMFFAWESIHHKWNGWLLILLQCITILTASLSRLASVATTIILQKDWIVILSGGDLDQLANINAMFRGIDLLSQVLAPIVVGVMQDYTTKLASAIFIGCWNVVSVFIEYYLLWLIYQDNPQLAEKSPPKVHTLHCSAKYAEHDECPEIKFTHCRFLQYQYRKYFYNWGLYFRHHVRTAGIALALLYMTVLGFDSVTTGFGATLVSTSAMGIAQGLSAAFGILGTVSFPFLRRMLGLGRVGMIGLMCEVLALVACVLSVWLPGSPFDASTVYPDYKPHSSNITHLLDPEAKPEPVQQIASVASFLGGIIVSRFGLWLTDITITQIFQEGIEEDKRGVINGVQDSMNMIMDMVKSVLVIIYPYPSQFGLLIVISFSFVCMGLGSYSIYYFNKACNNKCKEEKTVENGRQGWNENKEKSTSKEYIDNKEKSTSKQYFLKNEEKSTDKE